MDHINDVAFELGNDGERGLLSMLSPNAINATYPVTILEHNNYKELECLQYNPICDKNLQGLW